MTGGAEGGLSAVSGSVHYVSMGGQFNGGGSIVCV